MEPLKWGTDLKYKVAAPMVWGVLNAWRLSKVMHLGTSLAFPCLLLPLIISDYDLGDSWCLSRDLQSISLCDSLSVVARVNPSLWVGVSFLLVPP